MCDRVLCGGLFQGGARTAGVCVVCLSGDYHPSTLVGASEGSFAFLYLIIGCCGRNFRRVQYACSAYARKEEFRYQRHEPA